MTCRNVGVGGWGGLLFISVWWRAGLVEAFMVFFFFFLTLASVVALLSVWTTFKCTERGAGEKKLLTQRNWPLITGEGSLLIFVL